MGLSNKELLEKAVFSTDDVGGSGQAYVGVDAALTFIRLAIVPQMLLPDVRTVTHSRPKWNESQLDFSARIMRPGVEGERLTYENRVKPTTGIVEMSTHLCRGEVPITDEVEEDISDTDFDAALAEQMAAAVGRDFEDLFLNGDTNSSDPFLAQLDGWMINAVNNAHVYNAVSDGQDYQTIFKRMLNNLPDKYKRDFPNWRFYVPVRLHENYRDILAQRGTPLGDFMLEGDREIKYAGIPIRPVQLDPITSGTPDTAQILLTHRLNLYAGWQRQIRMETFRDPREGNTSHLVTARVDAQIGLTDAVVVATNVSVEP